MAKAPAQGVKGGGEVLKFIILILFMTSGGLALMSLVFWLFLIPSRHERLEAQSKDSNALVDLVEKKNNTKTRLWDLRRSYNEANKNPSTKTLRQMVEENLGGLGWSSFPPTQDRKKGNTVESVQTIDLKDATLKDIFTFSAQVKQENPGVQLGHINLSRRARSGSAAAGAAGGAVDEDKWSAKLEFFTYTTTTTTTTGAGAPGAAKAAPAAADVPSPESPPEPPPEEPAKN